MKLSTLFPIPLLSALFLSALLYMKIHIFGAVVENWNVKKTFIPIPIIDILQTTKFENLIWYYCSISRTEFVN